MAQSLGRAVSQRPEERTSDMADQVDEPREDSAATEEGQGVSSGKSSAPSAPVPFKHTRWERFNRAMYRVFGPAQTGLPPYATPEERERFRLAHLPENRRPRSAPPGYLLRQYRDGQGHLHHYMVPDTGPTANKSSEQAPSD